ncbi:MAG TPA: hypothetical protein VLA12_24075 [Planctomycetaceae bacterium]|nr:hypothetical protein [Planctomycetaceae bacterium]
MRPLTANLLICLLITSWSTSNVHGAEPVELTLTPRAIEQPLLKYRLLPAEFEIKDGNAATIILRMIWEQRPYMQEVYGTHDDDLELAIDDPKIIEIGTREFDTFFYQLKRAAYRRTAEWDYPIGDVPALFMLLPDVQGGREFVGKALSVWIRYQIARGELEKAREGILVGLAVSRHYARTPFGIIQLVSNAVNQFMWRRVEELLAHPNCPNMYWALTALPRPYLDIRSMTEYEERILESTYVGQPLLDTDTDPAKLTLDGLDDPDSTRTEHDWEILLTSMIDLCLLELGDSGQPKPEDRRTIRDNTFRVARRELPDLIEGETERVSRMSDAEAGVRWIVLKHREYCQEVTALMALDPPLALPALKDVQERNHRFRSERRPEVMLVLPSPHNIYIAARTNDRRIAAFRTVEAIRHYAATHDGRLPNSLDEISDPPVPDDPILMKPFHYEVNDDVATLSAEGIPGGARDDQADPGVLGEIQYHIRLRKPVE